MVGTMPQLMSKTWSGKTESAHIPKMAPPTA